MRKKPKIKYTDMAIYVDNNILNPDADVSLIYNYLQMLAYMLAVKRRFFNKEEYYDKFSHYLAIAVYTRMTTPRQYLDVSDSKYLSPIKSCLNYMKQILYARKCAFCFEEFNNTTMINDSNAEDAFNSYLKNSVLVNSNDILESDIKMYFSTLDKTIMGIIKNSVYKNNAVICWKLYTAVILLLLSDITIPNKYIKNFESYSITQKSNLDELFSKFRESSNKIPDSVFGLDSDLSDYAIFLSRKIKSQIVKDIQELGIYYKYTDDLIEDIILCDISDKEEG